MNRNFVDLSLPLNELIKLIDPKRLNGVRSYNYFVKCITFAHKFHAKCGKSKTVMFNDGYEVYSGQVVAIIDPDEDYYIGVLTSDNKCLMGFVGGTWRGPDLDKTHVDKETFDGFANLQFIEPNDFKKMGLIK